MPETVIVNTSPLFYLHRINSLELIQSLYNEIIIPEAVLKELLTGKEIGEDVPNIAKTSWIKVEEVQIPGFIKKIPDLGKGESEVLTLALKYGDSLAVIDDALARSIALINEIKFTGTAGILLKAKKNKLIPFVKDKILDLKTKGFFITDRVVKDILALANEG